MSAESIEVIALQQIRRDLSGAPAGCFRFFELIFARSQRADRGKTIAAAFALPQTTLEHRFFRTGLPSPSSYARRATFVILAGLLDDPTVSFARATFELNAGSRQAMERSVRAWFGLKSNEFRHAHSGQSMLERFRSELVLPYAEAWRSFDPAAPVDLRKRRSPRRRASQQTGCAA